MKWSALIGILSIFAWSCKTSSKGELSSTKTTLTKLDWHDYKKVASDSLGDLLLVCVPKQSATHGADFFSFKGSSELVKFNYEANFNSSWTLYSKDFESFKLTKSGSAELNITGLSRSSERTPHNLETRAFHLSVDTGKSIAFDVADFRAKSAVTKIFETPKFFNAKLAHQIEIAQLQTNDPLGEIDLDKLQNGAHMEAICAMKP